MASKPKSRGRGRNKAKQEIEEDDKGTSLAFKVLSSSQTKELLELGAVDDVQVKMAEIMKTPLHSTDLKDAAVLDYYTGAFWWGKEQQFTPQQLSAVFTAVHMLMNNIKEKQMTIVDNLKEFKKMTIGIGQETPENSGGLECLTVNQAKDVTDYIYSSLFQHYKMYEFMFSMTQAEEIIGTDLDVEVAPAADVPWPPPLEEAVTDEIFSDYILTPQSSPQPQEGECVEAEEGVSTTTPTERQETAAGEVEATGTGSSREVDLINQLTPEEVKAIMNSVMDEMVQGLQLEVAQKLREKENAFLNRINKIHKVEDKK